MFVVRWYIFTLAVKQWITWIMFMKHKWFIRSGNGKTVHFFTARARSLHFDGSGTSGSGSPGESDISGTPSSFASLPERVLPRPAPLLNQPSQDAMLEQIAELTRQNAAIRAQLEHSRASPARRSDRRASPPAGPQPTQQVLLGIVSLFRTNAYRNMVWFKKKKSVKTHTMQT